MSGHSWPDTSSADREELDELRAQLAAAQSQIQEMYATMKAADLAHAAELAKVTGLLRDLAEQWKQVVPIDGRCSCPKCNAYGNAHAYLNPEPKP